MLLSEVLFRDMDRRRRSVFELGLSFPSLPAEVVAGGDGSPPFVVVVVVSSIGLGVRGGSGSAGGV
jgi:hypothetical protein